MIERRIRFTETANRHVARERAWLLENRGQDSALVDELAGAFRILRALPGVGTRQDRAQVPGLRRIYLECIGCHLYYTFDDQQVIVRALWGARKRGGPRIGSSPES